MKKLLGGIFSRHPSAPASPPKSDGMLTASSSTPLSASTSAGGSPNEPKLSAKPAARSTPTDYHSYKTGPRGSWAAFFGGSHGSHKNAAATGSQSVVQTSPDVFNQNLDILLREVVGRMKPIITKILDNEEFTTELDDLLSFACLAADKIQQDARPPIGVLQDYFASVIGVAMCERTALLSLVVDFVGKMRVFLLKHELERMQTSEVSQEAVADGVKGVVGSTEADTDPSLKQPLQFLMNCVVAICSNAHLIEKYRCELPNLIELTAEEYPSSALYIRDLASQALASIPDKNFSAGLVWYLHDCSTIAKTIRTMSNYVSATPTTRENAAAALQSLVAASSTSSTREETAYGKRNPEDVVAAVSNALGLSKFTTTTSASTASRPVEPASGANDANVGSEGSAPERFCLRSYSVLTGFKTLVYVLHKTCRYSLVLLGEFQSSGGYTLMAQLLQSCPESDISTYLYLFTLLLPLGTGFSGIWGEDENMATVSACGARNVNAFVAMRDVVLRCIANLHDANAQGSSVPDVNIERSEQLVLQLLTTILHVYTSDYDNFVNLEPNTQTLALVLTQLPWITFQDGRVIVLRIVEYVCGAARADTILPTEILSVLCNLFVEYTVSENQAMISLSSLSVDDEKATIPAVDTKQLTTADARPRCSSTSDSPLLSLMLCRCITKIARDTSILALKSELRGFGLLDRGVYTLFVKIGNALTTMATEEAKQYLKRLEVQLSLWSSLLTSMMHNDVQACVEFRQLNMHLSLYTIAEALLASDLLTAAPPATDHYGKHNRFSVFSVLIELANLQIDDDDRDKESDADLAILRAGIEADFGKILGLLQRLRGAGEKQSLLIDVVAQMLTGGKFAWRPWQTCQGYEILISVLSSLDAMEEAGDSSYHIMDSVLGILSVTLDPQTAVSANLDYFKLEVGYPALASCLINSGILTTARLPFVMNRLFELITGNASPRNKIRNGDAVHTIFLVLPHLPVDEAANALNRLLLKLLSNDEVGFSKRKQISLLVSAGVFKWIAEPSIMSMLLEDNKLLKQPLLAFVVALAKEELSISNLRDFMRIIGRGMPLLLKNRYSPETEETIDTSLQPEPEVGLYLLENVFEASSVPQTKVGTQAKTRMTSGYVHVVNSVDRIWPPSSGYSFTCWLRLPPSADETKIADQSITSNFAFPSSDGDAVSTAAAVENNTVAVALCEGSISVKLEGDDSESSDVYGVLVGATLTLFASNETATRNEDPVDCLDVTSVAPNSTRDFFLWSHEKRYLVRCESSAEMEMWWRALQQSESISNITSRQKLAGELDNDSDVLYVPRGGDSPRKVDEVEGCACILSAYSLDCAGCFVRIYFEQGTGALRVDIGSVSTGPNMNANSKRNSVVFKTVDIRLLRPEHRGDSQSAGDAGATTSTGPKEKQSQWHHFAFTHRKVVVGSSLLTLYVDGSEVATKKLSYPSAPTQGTMQAFIGKDIQICGKYPALPWSIGPTWLTEEYLSHSAIACMFLLGPSFCGRFSGYAYRSIGDWPEALATTQLDRTTHRHVEIVRAAKRLQLAKLGRSSRRMWSDSADSAMTGVTGAAPESPDSSAAAKKGDGGEGFRASEGGAVTKKQLFKSELFQGFVKHECSMSSLGTEILLLLSSFKLSDDNVLFSLNTKHTIQSKAQVLSHTQVQYVGTEASAPLDLAKLLPSVGGVTQVLFPLLENSWRATELTIILRLLARVVRRNPSMMAECLEAKGYALVASLLCSRASLIDEVVLKAVFKLAVAGKLSLVSNPRYSAELEAEMSSPSVRLPAVVDYAALFQVVLCADLRRALDHQLQCQLLIYLLDLVSPTNPNALFNARQLRRADLLSWILIYLSELSSSDATLDPVAALQHRWCYPKFSVKYLDNVLQQVLSLLRAYLRVESHIDDVNNIAEMMLLSLASEDDVQFKGSHIRLILLQFILHEIEQDVPAGKVNNESATEGIAMTISNAVLYRSNVAGGKHKKKEKQSSGSSGISPTSVVSPTGGGDNAGSGFFTSSSVSGFDNTLLEIVARRESGPHHDVEALLAVRILLSLAQDYSGFAKQLFQPRMVQKFKRVLRAYSVEPDIYTPLLAYVSNIGIKDTKYYDPVLAPNGAFQQFALPTPYAFACADMYCLVQVWELLGSLLVQNALADTEQSRVINVIVLSQLSFQVEVSESFFSSICASSSIVLRIVVELLLPPIRNDESSDSNSTSTNATNSDKTNPVGESGLQHMQLQRAFVSLVTGRHEPTSANAVSVACLDFLRVLFSRLLFEKEDCAATMMFLLECLDGTTIQNRASHSLPDGQKCWLALLVHVVKSTKALSDNCSVQSLKNICTLAIALSRYLVDDKKHRRDAAEEEAGAACVQSSREDSMTMRPSLNREDSVGANVGSTSNCFGTDVLLFFLSSVRICAESHITQVVGADDQQFFYGAFVYCTQTVVLSEFHGVHKGMTPPRRLLDCLTESKQLLFQQTKCSSVIVCGTPSNFHLTTAGDLASGGTSQASTATSGIAGHLNRIKNPLANSSQKEFGIGSESDRSFILSLAAELFVMLVDDSDNVRYASIVLWQYVMQQRMGVLKELLIVEPRVSLLQNMTSPRKEVVDVFHGGFERLLQITPQRSDFATSAPRGVASAESELSRENWVQFHAWLTENFELLKDLILIRTEPIYLHLVEVLVTCLSVRKAAASGNLSTTSRAVQKELSLNTDFTLCFDPEANVKPIHYCAAYDDTDTGYRMTARKALLKYSTTEQTSRDAMDDGLSRWQELRVRLLHTRSIWHFSGWHNDTPGLLLKDDTQAEQEAPRGLFTTERSIFQQNAFRYRLDFTEGPQRLRIRLIRNYSATAPYQTPKNDHAAADERKIEPEKLVSVPVATHSVPPVGRKVSEMYLVAAEFHEAVDVFREYQFKIAAAQSNANELTAKDEKLLMREILSRCKFDSLRTALEDIESTDNPLSAVVIARQIYDIYLAKTLSNGSKLVASALAEDIERNIVEAETSADDTRRLQAILFDAADAEAMQNAICASRSIVSTDEDDAVEAPSETDTSGDNATDENTIDPSCITKSNDNDDDNDDDEDERMATDDERDDDEAIDFDGNNDRGKSGGAAEADPQPNADGAGTDMAPASLEETQRDTNATTTDRNNDSKSSKPVPGTTESDEAMFDSSCDYIYGSIARFLQREDYPPLRCYNAAYIAGMTRFTGIFVLCRHALYFIGGYGKLLNPISDTTDASSGAAGVFPLFSGGSVPPSGAANSLSPTGKTGASTTGGSKKKAKDLIRTTLADISTQFSSKNANEQLFTVVAIPHDQSAPGSIGGSSAAGSAGAVTAPRSSKCWNIKYSNVKQFCRMKYQLRPVGIEFFDTSGSTFFLQFDSVSDRDDIIKFVFQMPIVNSVFWSPVLRSSALSLSAKRIRQALMKRWQRGQMSNFEYLMHLNVLAGRTFNDLTQYPVFPWVVADYNSEFLDLDAPSTFRDLSKPMGALNDHRAAQFRERYHAMGHDMDSPAFHYGTHYSCSAYVVNYLIRLEPYTKLAIELQGGYFDHADRLFRSIPSSWESASTENLQDVRELIPEFFYLPEFLYNANNYDFGTTQSGEVVSHVRLPKWAHGDPREFIRIHRRALESKYVSENLHHWIDLVFGVKQTGPAALEALNVFMHITYEGTVDIDQIEDPVMRNATLAQIENFGQTPSKIFTNPHPARKVPSLFPSTPVASPIAQQQQVQQQHEANSLSTVEAYVKWHSPLAPALVSIGKDYVFLKKIMSAKALDGPVSDLVLVNDKFHCRGVGCRFMPPRFMKYIEWGSADGSIKLRVHQTSARYREANKVVGVIEGAHFYKVNCATISDDGSILVTGGEDAAVNVLECSKVGGQRVFKQLAKLVGHEDAIVSVAINKGFNIIASGSSDCGVILWDLRTRAFLRELAGHMYPVDKVAINSANGNVMTATTQELRVWSINGDLLAACTVQGFGLSTITCAISTRCESWQNGVVAVTGHSNGTIALWGISYPSDMEKDRRALVETELASPSRLSDPPTSGASKSAALRAAIRVGRSDGATTLGLSDGMGSTTDKPAVFKVIPSCQLYIMKLLLDHRSAVTALTLNSDQRQLLSGDADGNCIRWMDDSVSVNIL